MKRPRYQHGFFSRVKRKSGPDVWTYRWREIGPKGEARMRKQVIGTVEQYPSKTALWKAVQLLQFDINSDCPRPESVPTRFGELIGHYRKVELDRSQPSNRKKDQTKQVYDNNLRIHIEPRWRQYRPLEITAVAVERWLSALELADGTKAKLKYIMSDVFQHGIRYGWLRNQENPMLSVRQSARRVRIPEPLESSEFLALLEKLPFKVRTIGIVCATTGLRISEVLGLKWGDIDFARSLFHVTRSVVDGVVGVCKTETSSKPLPLNEVTLASLSEWRHACFHRREEDWVFASEWRDGRMPPWADTLLTRFLRPGAKAAGIRKRVGWHTFRHTYSTLLQANEEDVKVVQELMRHANITTTMNVYTQAVTTKKRQAQSRVVDVLFGRTQEGGGGTSKGVIPASLAPGPFRVK